MTKNKNICDKYNLESVDSIFTGAAPLGFETVQELQRQYPKWKIRQGYGMYCAVQYPAEKIGLSNSHDRHDRDSHGSTIFRP